MKTQTSIKGAQVDASTIDQFALHAEIDANVDSFTIDQIAGDIDLQSVLEKGKMTFHFSPYFNWGGSWMALEASDDADRLRAQLKQKGLSDEQIDDVESVLRSEPPKFKKGKPPVLKDNGLRNAVPKPDASPSDLSFDVPLPNIPINVHPTIDVRNFSVDNIKVGASTQIESEHLSTKPAQLQDFSLFTDVPDIVTFDSININKSQLRPIDIPNFSLPDLQTQLNIPKLGASQIPLKVDSQSGGSDVRVNRLIDWRPRWRAGIEIDLWFTTISLWVEFGVDLTADLYYRWTIKLLHVALNIKNAFFNAISVGIKISNFTLNKIRIGLLSAANILSKIVS